MNRQNMSNDNDAYSYLFTLQGEFDAGYLYECQFVDDAEKANIPPETLYLPSRSVPVNHSNDQPINIMNIK